MSRVRVSGKRDIGSFEAHKFYRDGNGKGVPEFREQVAAAEAAHIMLKGIGKRDPNNEQELVSRYHRIIRRRRNNVYNYTPQALIKLFQKIENDEAGPLCGYYYSLQEIIEGCIRKNDFKVFDEAIKFYIQQETEKSNDSNEHYNECNVKKNEQEVKELFLLFKMMKEECNTHKIYKENESFLRNIIKEAIMNKDFYVLEEAIKRLEKV